MKEFRVAGPASTKYFEYLFDARAEADARREKLPEEDRALVVLEKRADVPFLEKKWSPIK